MRLNTEWLRELVPVPASPRDIGQRLTALGLEVETLVELRGELAGVVVGEVASIEPIEGSSGLFVCRVDVGRGPTRQIVCGSEHPLEPGWRVPIALPGTDLPSGVAIHETRFRGVLSQGMICLDRELGILPKGDGLQVFPEEVEPGVRLIDVTEVPDTVITVSVLPNRPDCLGLVGIARELAAAYGVELVRPDGARHDDDRTAPGAGIEVEIVDALGCPRYTARVLNGVVVEKSPLWLSSRVAIAGFRPINNVVDVTNLVQYEYGQPLHAFDLARLEGAVIRVRSAVEGEAVTLFGGKRVELRAGDLVIADRAKAVALAGIMGSADSGVAESTRDIVLESAYFDPVRVRETSRRLQLRTEASKRFERGVDPNAGVLDASDRAAGLLLELAGGRLRRDTVDVYPVPVSRRRFQVRPEFVERHLGFAVAADAYVGTLERLGMEHAGDFHFLAPTWRADATEAVVLVEDVFRHHGYANSPRNPPTEWVAVRGQPQPAAVRRRIRELLLDEGFWEARTFSLDSIERLENFTDGGGYLTLSNPPSSEMTTLRSSLVPRLLDVVVYNGRRHRAPLRFFEIDTVFSDRAESLERWTLAAVASGPALDSFWRGPAPPLDYFVLKGVVQRVVDSVGLGGAPNDFASAAVPWLDAAESARVLVDGREIAVIGRLDGDLVRRWELPGEVHAFELDLQALSELARALPPRRYRPLPRFPSIDRDLSLVVPVGGSSAASLERAIRAVGGELVESIRCHDVYEGSGIEDGFRSLTFMIRYRRHDRTLTSEEVGALEGRIIEELESGHGARLRGGGGPDPGPAP